jgi:hypothetical protein
MVKKFLLRFLLFLLIPMFTCELVFRLIPSANNFYLSKVDPFYSLRIEKNKKLYLFIGSSHVRAAIIPEIIDDHLKTENIFTFNAARGMSTATTFYYALNKLSEDGLLKNSVVFLEAPGGISSYESNVHGDWIDERDVHLIIPYLDKDSYIQFLKYSSNSLSAKWKLSLNYLLYSSRVFSLIKELYNRNSINDIITKVSHKEKKQLKEDEMVDQGGIKIDKESIEKARKFAYAYSKEVIESQKPINESQWENSRLNEIIDLLKRNNSCLILFRIPLSSVEEQVYQTEISKQNIEVFRKFLMNKEATFMDIDCSSYRDEDFPDLWHLSKSKAIEFSNEFATLLVDK